MKKLMMLAALLAMVLVAAAPAMAQTVEGDVTEGDTQYADDATVQTAENVQYCINILDGDNATDTDNVISGDTGDENAIGGGNIDQELVNECEQVVENALADDGSVAVTGGVEVDADEDGDVDAADAEAAAAASASASAGSDSEGSEGSEGGSDELPATGGVSLLTLGAGALLVAGGLVARRIVR